MKHNSLARFLCLPLLAAGLTLPAPALPLSIFEEETAYENPSIKLYMGRVAGDARPLMLVGGSKWPQFFVNDRMTIPLLPGEEVRASCLADVNGDGSDDFIAVLDDNTGGTYNPGSRLMATYFYHPDGFYAAHKIPFSSSNNADSTSLVWEQIVPADLDRDGDMDIVLLDNSYRTNEHASLSFFTNAAIHTGRFETETSIALASRNVSDFSDVVVMQTNVDDFPDIVLADRLQDKIQVYVNNAAGGFTPGTVITEDGPSRLYTFDVDRDGRKDLLSTSGSDDDTAPARLVWRKSTAFGLGSLSILDTQSGKTWYGGVTVADITEDGTDDLVFVRSVGNLTSSGAPITDSSVWYRPGNPAVAGAFFNTIPVPGTSTIAWPIHSIAAGDLDADGDLDLWDAQTTTSFGRSFYGFLMNIRPHGESSPAAADYPGTSPAGATTLAAGDLNSDSWPDLIAAAEGTKAILWYAGGPGGTLAAPVTVSTGGLAPSFLSAGDIDFDGNVDLAWGVAATGEIKRTRNTNGTGTSWSTANIATVPGLNSVTMTNVNRDMDLDFLAGSSNGTVQWFYNNIAAGTWTTETVLTQPGLARAVPVWVKTNVRQQVIALSHAISGSPGKVDIRDHFLLGNPPWTVLHSENAGTANTVTAAATAADCDKDGYADCVWAAGSNEVKWRTVKAAAATTYTIGTAPGTVRNLRCMDWNGDGMDDILCAHSAGVLVWLNRLGETWDTLPLYTGGNCTDAIPFRLDADPFMDVAAVDATSGKLKRITHTAPIQIEVTDRAPVQGEVTGEPSATSYVMIVAPKHLGIGVDADAIPDRFRFRFLKAVPNGLNWMPGPPMTQAELSASVEKIMVVYDSANGVHDSLVRFDSPNDVILGEAGVSLANGYQTVNIGTSDTILDRSMIAVADSPRRLFVALKFKPAVSSVATGRFYIEHVTEGDATPTRYVTAEGWPDRQPLNVAGGSGDTYRVRIITPVELWRKSWYGTTSNSGAAADSADGDKDGMGNLAEYILGKNPTVADASPPVSILQQNGSFFVFVDLPPTAREDGIITLQQSPDLLSWSTYATSTGGLPWSGAPYATVFENGLMHSTFAPPGGSQNFYRLRFSLIP